MSTTKNRAPGFMLYAEKAMAGTAHLSPKAFKFYWLALFWMWSHSKDQHSIKNEQSFIRKRVPMTALDYKKFWLEEILDDEDPLLIVTDSRLISVGLRKEFEKQKEKSERGKKGASARWRGNTDGEDMPPHAPSICPDDAGDMPSISSSTSSSKLEEEPSSSSSLGEAFKPKKPGHVDGPLVKALNNPFNIEAKAFQYIQDNSPPLRSLQWDQWLVVTRRHEARVILSRKFLDDLIGKAELEAEIRSPAKYINAQAGYWAKDNIGEITKETVRINEDSKEVNDTRDLIRELLADASGMVLGMSTEERIDSVKSRFKVDHGPEMLARLEHSLKT